MKKALLRYLLILTITLLFVGIANVHGLDRYSVATGNWNSTGTWSATPTGASGASVPVAGDVVYIQGNKTVTITANATCTTLNIASGSILSVGAFSLTVSGNTTVNGTITFTSTNGTKTFTGLVTINSGGTWTNNINESFTFQGGLTNYGTFTAGTGTYLFNTNAQALSGTLSIPRVTVNVITLTNNGALTIGTALSGTGGLTQAPIAILNIGGTSGITTLTAISSGNTINYTGAAQTVKGTTYNNLTLSGSGLKTTTSVTVNGILSMEGTATVSVAPTYGSSATLRYNTSTARAAGIEWVSPFAASGGVIIANTGTITMNGAKVFNTGVSLTVNSLATLNMSTFLLTLNGDFINNGTASGTTGGVTIGGTATQTIDAFTTTGTVSMTKTGGTATFTGNVNGNGLTINGPGGILNLGADLTHTFSGTITFTAGNLDGGSSLFRIGGSVGGTGTGTFTPNGGTVEWYGGAQTVAGVAYNNLTLSGSGVKTMTSVTVNGVLSMEGTAIASVAPTFGVNAALQYNTATSRAAGAEWITPFVATGGVNIVNAGIITLNAAKVFSTTAPLTIANGATLATSTFLLTINGNLINSGAITSTAATLSFNSGASYQHAQNGGTVPTATWNAASNCNITGITSATSLTGLGQTFGNFTWNCTGQTGTLYMESNMTVAGNFTVLSTGAISDATLYSLRMSNTITGYTIAVNGNVLIDNGAGFKMNNASGSCTMNIGGNLTINSGNFTIATGTENSTVNVAGNVILSNGTFTLKEDPVAFNGTLNVNGNFTQSGGTITVLDGGGGIGAINFNGTTTQAYQKTAGTIANNINFTVNGGAILDMGTSVIDGSSGTFTLSSGAGIITAHAQGLSTTGLTGCIQVAGSRTYNNGANYTYNGSVAQSTGDGFTGAVNLTINNAAGVTLSAATTVSGTLALANGTVTSSATNTLTVTNSSTSAITGGSASRFVNGPLNWQLTTGQTYTYPIGKGSTYLPFELTDITGSAPRIRAEAFAGNCGGSVLGTLGLLSTTEYWQASVISGTYTTGSVSLTRQTALNGLDAIARSATQGGAYASLNGSINGMSIISSDLTGNALGYFVMASKSYITTGTIASTAYCPGASVDVPFTVKGAFSSGNIFTAQLSNSSGSFATPVNIGTLTSTAAGTISATIPAGTVAGTGYRIRVISSSPNVIGSDNGSNITIATIPSAPTTTGSTICIGSTATMSASGAVVGDKYKWYSAATGGTVLKTSTDNNDNTYTTAVLGATTNYWVSIVNTSGCESSRSIVAATYPAASSENADDAGTDTWIGHVYDGISFNTYYGRYTEPETFNESFGGSTNCFAITSSGVSQSIYTETFSVIYRMNSSKKGLYVVDLGSDDGSRLTVDGTVINSSWTSHALDSRPGVLMNLTGSSSLMYEFYENGGGNQILFQNLTFVFGNNLSSNTTQSICLGNTGSTISGDVYGTLPTGISLSGTGYQWTYSATPDGARTVIAGATQATYTPSTLVAPFNSPGTYYLYRNAVLSSANNISPNPYVATNESNVATVVVYAPPTVSAGTAFTKACSSNVNGATIGEANDATATYLWSPSTGLSSTTVSNPIANPAVTTTYTVTKTNIASGCSSQATVTVTVNNTPPVVGITGSSSICMGGTTNLLPVSGGTWVSNNPTLASVTNGGVVTGLSAGSATFTFIQTSTGCTSTTLAVTVSAPPSAPTVGTITQPTCSLATGNVELNGLPASGTWTLTRSPGGTITTGTGTSTILSGLAAGTYTFTVTNQAGCTSAASANVTINTQPETPVITGISSGSRCGTGTVTIGATASWGTINWYDALTGGTFMGTGESFITPNLSSSTTYYAEAMGDGCTSGSRAEVTASVITPPSISASGGGTFCNASMITLSSSSSHITNQYWVGPNNFYSLNQNVVLTGVTSDMSGQYIVTGSMLSGINLVTNGDFEAGNTGFTSDYTTALPTSTGLYPEGTYDIVTSPSLRHANFCSCSNHTPGSGTLQMVINGASAEKSIWSQTVNINPNTAYQFTYWVQTVVNGNDASPSKLQLYVNETNAGPVYTANPTTGVWTQFTYNWTSGPSDTRAVLTLKNENFATGGNDFALDDIVFQQACEVTDNVTVTVNATVTSGTIGTSQSICKGDTPAPLTSIAAGTGSGMISYEWQSNAGGSYVTISGATAATYSPPAVVATTSYQRRTVSVSGGITCYSPYTTPVTITVFDPFVIAGNPISTCQSATPAAITLSGASVGGGATTGAWSIVSGGGTLSSTIQTSTPATVTYTPAANYSGTVILRLTANLIGSCAATSERTITIVPAPTAVAGPALFTCSNSGSVNITEGSSATNSLAVVWTSSGTGIFANANSLTTAAYTPSAADIAAGSVTLTLTATGTSPCSNAISTKTLTITPLQVATFSYTDSPYCSNSENPSPTFSGGGVAGTFSSSPEGLVFISNASGQVDLTASTPGIYNVANTIAASGGCDNVTATATIAIVRLPVATFSYPQSPYCSNSANPVPLFISGGVAGTFSSSAGLKFVNNNTGEIDLRNSLPGTYTVTNTIISSACGSVTAFSDVTVNDAPTASGVTICTGGSGSLQFNSTCPDLNGLTRGPNNPRIGASISGIGSVAWINPENITTNNSLYATAALTNAASISNYLYARDYGFNIPGNAIITGIQVIVNRSSSHSNSIQDNVVKLIVNGNIAGINKARIGSWPTSMTSVTYGSSSDMWSLTSATLTPAVVNASNFGVALACEKTASGSKDARINYIQVIITYKVTGEIKWYTESSGGTAIYTGASFNPEGIAGGLVNTNIPGTYTFYAECTTNPQCRAQADFVINARPIIANKTVTTCSGTAFTVSPTNDTDIVPTGTTYSWSAPSVAGITGTAAASNAASISGTLTNTTNTPINVIYIVTPSSVSCSGNSFTVTIKVNPDGSWTGAMDTDWNNPANWACNQLPTLTTNVTIANGLPRYPIVSTEPAGMARDIFIGPNATVTVTGGTLQIAGSIANSGIFTATEGTIEMKGSAPQTIGANVFSTNTLKNLIINNEEGVTLAGPLNITGVVSPLIGNLSSGGHLTLLSTPSQTALIDGVGSGNVVGNVNIQRYLSSSFGYKYFSSPFQSAAVGAFATLINLTETFPTFYKYDENNSILNSGVTSYKSGWVKYTTFTDPLIPMAGYAANMGSINTPQTFTMSGVVNNGPQSLTLYNHNREYTKGFNLVGNPYPSPINWNALGWTKDKIDNAIYFFNAGNTDRYTGVYSSYVNGISSGNANNIIAAMQGFFVHVSDGTYPVQATLGMTNAVRINTLTPVFKSAVIDNRPTLRLTAGFEIKDAIEDAAVVYFDPTARVQFEKEKDALKLDNTDELVPNIYTITPDSRKLSINGLSEPSDSVSFIPLGITTFRDGLINFRAVNADDLPFTQVYLADAVTGQSHNLRQSPDVRFTLQRGVCDNRFKLVFSKAPFRGSYPGLGKLFMVVRSGNRILVKVDLPDTSKGYLLVTNLLGQTIMRREVTAKQTVEINQSITTGVYVITLVSGKRTESEKILMRHDYE